MTSQQILQSDVLDILFERRNKAYGAYLLRKNYPKELVKAVGITASLVIVLLFFGKTSSTASLVEEEKEGYQIISCPIAPLQPEPPKQKPQQRSAPQLMKQEMFVDKIKPVDLPKEQIATQDELDNATPGNSKVDGPPATGVPASPLPPSTGLGITEKEPEKVDPPLPSRQPQFPGGAAAWLKFLERNLTPPSDLEAGEKRSVLVRFSVDEEGVVTNFKVVQSGGADFDNEVIRVLKKMPRWLPAIQAGKPTAVSFTQPVTFQAAE